VKKKTEGRKSHDTVPLIVRLCVIHGVKVLFNKDIVKPLLDYLNKFVQGCDIRYDLIKYEHQDVTSNLVI
jgi:hypothetical protein